MNTPPWIQPQRIRAGYLTRIQETHEDGTGPPCPRLAQESFHDALSQTMILMELVVCCSYWRDHEVQGVDKAKHRLHHETWPHIKSMMPTHAMSRDLGMRDEGN